MYKGSWKLCVDFFFWVVWEGESSVRLGFGLGFCLGFFWGGWGCVCALLFSWIWATSGLEEVQGMGCVLGCLQLPGCGDHFPGDFVLWGAAPSLDWLEGDDGQRCSSSVFTTFWQVHEGQSGSPLQRGFVRFNGSSSVLCGSQWIMSALKMAKKW